MATYAPLSKLAKCVNLLQDVIKNILNHVSVQKFLFPLTLKIRFQSALIVSDKVMRFQRKHEVLKLWGFLESMTENIALRWKIR